MARRKTKRARWKVAKRRRRARASSGRSNPLTAGEERHIRRLAAAALRTARKSRGFRKAALGRASGVYDALAASTANLTRATRYSRRGTRTLGQAMRRNPIWTSSDGTVRAEINRHGDKIAIEQFSSLSRGKGNAQRALKELGAMGDVYADGVGRPGDGSYAFWKKMLDRGHISAMVDDDGNEVRRRNPLDFPTLATGAALGAGSFAASTLLGAVMQRNGRRRRRRR